MEKVLINVDYTNDFIADNGALTCGNPGQEIEKEIVSLTKQFIEQQQLVVFAIDLHKKGDQFHPETKLYPPHNIEGTEGRKLFGELENVYQNAKHLDHVLYINKTRYSAFAGTDLFIKLRERGIDEVHIVGCATDICCLHTAIDAYNLGFKIVIHKKAVASFNPVGHEWALQHFEKSLNATII
ncbi:cysteine hydrolase [Bacillus aquiflavi]|uniref:Cysteine hydrolase n=1 Tax=Bacillus aquiflavi TaxID=2672567 RepID=A0A6B3W6V3_9BACI|nr:isochorismatase family cysteine hydrolase [Bacillus aquiflavi]MBA4538783.1 cysteine hydrolase [Bacillus aquiflavi]NEY83134.1 cysteine hydrolase [Bacillus aquiflavi]UAC49022.1 cysteine hydrolase [Bacillus aquiflavi]